MSDHVVKVLWEARELMRGGHWCKGRNYHNETNSFCILGAISMAATGNPYGLNTAVDEAREYAMSLVRPEYWHLGQFNDTHEWIDVDTLLTHAIDKAKET